MALLTHLFYALCNRWTKLRLVGNCLMIDKLFWMQICLLHITCRGICMAGLGEEEDQQLLQLLMYVKIDWQHVDSTYSMDKTIVLVMGVCCFYKSVQVTEIPSHGFPC